MPVPIPCEEILLRALRRQDWIDPDTMQVTSAAYMRDPVRDPDGLSVNQRTYTNLETWPATVLSSHGIDSLHTGAVRAIDEFAFEVVDDAEDRAHALIVGVPSVQDDAAKAERAASILARISRNVDRLRRPRHI